MNYINEALYISVTKYGVSMSQLTDAQQEAVREIAKEKLTEEQYKELFSD